MNNYQRYYEWLAKEEKKYNAQGYTISSYTNKYGYDYEILVDADDVYSYVLNNYLTHFAKHIYEKCKKNVKYLCRVVRILDDHQKDDWKETKKYIFEEKRGGLYVN